MDHTKTVKEAEITRETIKRMYTLEIASRIQDEKEKADVLSVIDAMANHIFESAFKLGATSAEELFTKHLKEKGIIR